ncbi:MAG: Gfo/Idh/MocA family oxidoreductase [Mucilaginibacter polytrichastri]|nr:Gfo/Idh/MocA family oxidoreductase [Mucilaginibacter polytrichastri]
MKIGVIGLGDIAAKAYLPVLSAIQGVEIHLLSRDQEKVRSIAKQYRFSGIHTSISSLIAATPDAVFIHAATVAHIDLATPLIEAGIAVFVDKPISLHYDESALLVSLAKEKNTLLMVGFNRRYAPVYQQAKELANPTMIIMQKNRRNLPGSVRSFILDDFIHVIDTLLWLFPFPVTNQNVSFIAEKGMLNQVTVQLIAAGGQTAIGIMNRNTSVNEERLEIMSPEQKCLIENVTTLRIETKNSSNIYRMNDWEPTLYRRGFAPMIEDFIRAVSEKTTPVILIDDALFTHKICEDIISAIGHDE